MRGTVGEFLIDRLVSNGVKHCYGVPGDYNLKFYDRLSNSAVKLIGTTNELNAGYAADVNARVNGISAVCVTYCVGGLSVVNAIACAYAEKSPVIIISGSPGIKEREEKYLLHHMVGTFESQLKVFQNITCASTVLKDSERAGYEIDRVLTALNEFKQPIYIELPRDMVDKPIRYDPYTLLTPRPQATDKQNLEECISEVTSWVSNAKNPVIWAGVEVSRFNLGDKLLKFAEQTNIPIASTVLGKSVVNEDHPLSLGVYCESTSSEELNKLMESSDCIIMLGVMMTDLNTGFLPLKYNKRNIILATTNTCQVGNHSYSCIRFADFMSSLFNAKIVKHANRELPKNSLPKFSHPVAEKSVTISRLFEYINSILTPDMAVIADVGDALFGSLNLRIRHNNSYICDAFYTTMGMSVPGTLGLMCAEPKVRPIVIVGDGAFQMTGMEFVNIVKQQSKINSVPPIIFVLNNQGYGTERIMKEGPYNEITPWEYEKIPEVVGGGSGYKVFTEDQMVECVQKALNSNQPSIINVVLDRHDFTPSLKKLFSRLAKSC